MYRHRLAPSGFNKRFCAQRTLLVRVRQKKPTTRRIKEGGRQTPPPKLQSFYALGSYSMTDTERLLVIVCEPLLPIAVADCDISEVSIPPRTMFSACWAPLLT